MNRSRRAAAPTFAVVVAVALALSGCGKGTTELDRAATEKAVAKAAADELPTAPTKVVCPAKIPKRKGASVTCTATVTGLGAVRLQAMQPDGSGRLEVSRLDAIVRTDDVAETATSDLSERLGRAVKVVCSTPRPVVVKPGGLLVCHADDGSSTRTVNVTVVDASGSLSYELVK